MSYAYTYAEYLEDWKEHYYDDAEGDFVCMTEVQFDHANFQIGVIGAEIDGLLELPDSARSSEFDDKVLSLYNKSFEFELALFM